MRKILFKIESKWSSEQDIEQVFVFDHTKKDHQLHRDFYTWFLKNSKEIGHWIELDVEPEEAAHQKELIEATNKEVDPVEIVKSMKRDDQDRILEWLVTRSDGIEVL